VSLAPLAYPIRTSRLALRPLIPDDADDLVAYRSRPDVCRWVPFSPMDRADVLTRIVGVWADHQLTDEGQSLTLGIELADEPSRPIVIGDAVLFWHSREHASGEVGYVLNPDYGGHGYATEAARAMLDVAFGHLHLHRVTARVDARNHESQRLALRLGMRQEAHLVENEWFKGGWSDEIDFAILDREWGLLSGR
jgi:RimJ/RimL family protein N-acetyltransferase